MIDKAWTTFYEIREFSSSNSLIRSTFTESFDFDSFVREKFEETQDSFFIQVYEFSSIQMDIKIKDISVDKTEILFETKSLLDEDELNLLIQQARLKCNKKSQVVNVEGLELNNNEGIFIFSDAITALNRNDKLTFFKTEKFTEVLQVEFNQSQEKVSNKVLTGHRRDNLNNFYENVNRKTDFKSFENLFTSFNDLQTQGKLNISRFVEIDFSSFENFVRFGSAKEKIKRSSKIINKVIELQNKLSTQNIASSVVLKTKSDINNQIQKFDEYENYVYQNIYLPDPSEFSSWLEQSLLDAEEYDLNNPEFIIRRVSEDLINYDRNGRLATFLYLIGDVFDRIWLNIKALEAKNNFSFIGDQMTSTVLRDVLDEMGIKSEISYVDKNLQEFFDGSVNFSRISNIITKRLVYNLPFLFKKKGTISTYREILEMFGFKRNLVEIYESSIKRNVKGEVEYNHEEEFFYLEKKLNNDVHFKIDEEDFNNQTSMVLVYKNLSFSSGSMFKFGNVELTFDKTLNSGIIFKIFENDVETFSFQEKNYSDGLWNMIVFSFDLDENKLYLKTTSKTFSINIQSEEKNYTLTDFLDGVEEIDILDGAPAHIHSFKIFNSILSNQEVNSIINLPRSTASKLDTIFVDVYFEMPKMDFFDEVSPVTTPVYLYNDLSVVDANSDPIKSLYISNLEKDDFFKSFFEINVNLKSLPDIHLENNNVEIVDHQRKKELSSKYRINSIDNTETYDGNVSVVISPVVLSNFEIIRKFGNFSEYIPEPFDGGFGNFSSLTKKFNSYLSENSINVNDYFTLYKLINLNVFNLMKEFTPATTNLTTGIMIKNNIVNKKRGVTSKNRFQFQLNDSEKLLNSNNNLESFVVKELENSIREQRLIYLSEIEKQLMGVGTEKTSTDGEIFIQTLTKKSNEFYNRRIIKPELTVRKLKSVSIPDSSLTLQTT